jgi:hypothetical protein
MDAEDQLEGEAINNRARAATPGNQVPPDAALPKAVAGAVPVVKNQADPVSRPRP